MQQGHINCTQGGACACAHNYYCYTRYTYSYMHIDCAQAQNPTFLPSRCRMGCHQSSVASLLHHLMAPERVARVGPGDSQQADSLSVPDTSETALSKLPTRKRKRKRKKVKPTNNIIVPAVPTVESTLTRGNRVLLPSLQQCPLPPGIVLVRKASPDSRVDLTHPASPTAHNRFRHT